MTNKELFYDKFPAVFDDVRFFGHNGEVYCTIHSKEVVLNSDGRDNIYDAFSSAYAKIFIRHQTTIDELTRNA